jgi:hypothetical protein
MFWKVDKLARMDPPVQELYLRSEGATTRAFTLLGARLVSSFVIRLAMPGYMVVPPARTTLLYLRESLVRISRTEPKAEKASQIAADIGSTGVDLENALYWEL